MAANGHVALLHRCRFFGYQPTAVNALAFSPDGAQLAVGRANADVEVWSLAHDWVQDKRMPGVDGSSVEALVWTPDARLFAAGHHALITEWDTQRLQPRTSSDSYGGAVWCLAVSPTGSVLAAGCEDGSVRLFDLSDGQLRYIRSLDGQKGRILSVAWAADGLTLISGSAEGTIRLWSIEKARTVKRFSVPSNDPKSPALVWTLAILPDKTIVSGDSQGNVVFWDAASGTVAQSVLSHSADVLSVVASRDGQSLYATGVDNKVVQLRLLDAPVAGAVRWVISGTKRVHTHDIRALALAPTSDLLVSGSVDTNLVAYSAQDLGRTNPRIIPPFPHKPLVVFARARRLLCCMYPRHVELWVLGKAAPTVDGLGARANHAALPLAEGHGKIAELRLKGGRNLVCTAVSDDGHWLAVADSATLKLFRIDYEDDGQVRLRLLNGLPEFDSDIGARTALTMTFLPESSRLVAAHHDGSVSVLELRHASSDASPVRAERVLMHHRDVPADARGTVCSLAASADGAWLVTADSANHIFLINAQTWKRAATVPAFSSRHTTIAFHSATGHLLVACADNTVFAFSPDTRQVIELTRGPNARLTKLLQRRREKIVGIVCNPGRPHTVVVWGLGYLCELNVRKELLPGAIEPEPKKAAAASRKRADDMDASPAPGAADEPAAEEETVKLVHDVQPCLFLDYVDADELVAVQRPWLAVMEAFPPKLYRPRYGA